MQKKNNDAVQVAALLSAQEYLADIPAGAPKAVVDYATSRVKALGGRPLKKHVPARKLTPPEQAIVPAPAPPPAPPAPPTPDAFAMATARAVIAQADVAAAEVRKALLIEQLKAVRADLAVKRPILAVLASRIMGLRDAGQNLARAIEQRQERISALMAERPVVLDFIPSDPEAVAWRAAVEQRESEIAQLRAAGAALPNLYQLQLSAVTLQGEIQQLEWTQTNILNRLNPVRGSAWGGHLITGGVFTAF